MQNRFTRRRFVQAGAAALAASSFPALSLQAKTTQRKRVAILATEVRRHSHAQHFIDRLLEGYAWHGKWHHPQIQLTSLFVDQFPDKDLARDRSKRFNVPIYPTLEESLTEGGSKLAVDGVIIIGEHGKYPRNEKGQMEYPRYPWFKKIVKIFEDSGRSVPVFNDKHLSTTWAQSLEMVEDSRRLKFEFLAGSSLPVTWRIPSLELPLNCNLVESVAVAYGGVDSYDFHGLETAQCMSERRKGGESGVKSVQVLKGDPLWNRLAEEKETQRLFFAALMRCHTLRIPDGYPAAQPDLSWIRKASPEMLGYYMEHYDGFRTTLFMANGLVQDFTYAGRMKDGKIESCQMQLPMPMQISTTADFFNPLMNNIEKLVLENRAPYPVERTLLTSGMTLFGVESLFRKGELIETPEMKVRYRAPKESSYWRA